MNSDKLLVLFDMTVAVVQEKRLSCVSENLSITLHLCLDEEDCRNTQNKSEQNMALKEQYCENDSDV